MNLLKQKPKQKAADLKKKDMLAFVVKLKK